MKKCYFLTFIFCCSLSVIHAQFYEYISFGLKAGVNHSLIQEIPEMMRQDINNPLVYLETEPQIGGHFGAFLNFRGENRPIAFQSELIYSMEHTTAKRSENDELRYEVEFNYNYLLFNTLLKFYAYKGLSIGVGPQLGFNLSPDNIVFHDYLYPENNIEVQQQMRDSSYGRTNFQLMFDLGYEWDFGLMINARYNLGFSDVIRTDNNYLNWRENKNTSSTFQFSVGYAFGLSTY